mgnify:CR=1 FL=1
MDAAPDRDDSLVGTDIHVQATYRLTEALVDAENRMRRRIDALSEIVFETDADDSLEPNRGSIEVTVTRVNAVCVPSNA